MKSRIDKNDALKLVAVISKIATSMAMVSLAAMTSAEVSAQGFDFSRINSGEIDTSQWQCETCLNKSNRKTDVSVNAGYSTDSKLAQERLRQSDSNGVLAETEASYLSRQKQYQLTADAKLSTGQNNIQIEMQRHNSYSLALNANQIVYQDDLNITPRGGLIYGGTIGANNSQFDRKKQQTQIKAEKYLSQNTSVFVELEHKKNTASGTRLNYLFFNQNPQVVFSEVDNKEIKVNTGIQHQLENGQFQLSYQASRLTNDGKVYGQTILNNDRIARSTAPNSLFQTVALSVNYRVSEKDHLFSQLSYGTLEQNKYLNVDQLAVGQNRELNGSIDSINANVRWIHQFFSRWNLNLDYAFDQRKNKLDVPLFVNGIANWSKNNLRSQRYSSELSGPLAGLNLKLGAENRSNWRPDQNREHTDQTRLWLKARKSLSYRTSLTGEIAWSDRDGSEFKNTSQSMDYYLADLQQQKIELKMNTAVQRLGINTRLYLLKDQYDKSQSSLVEENRLGAILGASYHTGQNHSFYGSLSLERTDYLRDYTQPVSNGQGGYFGEVDQQLDFSGINIGSSWQGLQENHLDLSIDINWLQSIGDYQQVNAENADFRSTLVEISGDYRLTPKLSLQAEMAYQRTNEDDWQQDSIYWLGSKQLNESGYQYLLGMKYQF
ncbi:MtrB/PioB family outer membrane beta-barrel protein [Pelagibaculum spongiae]|uniref:MtrB/PioB family decaheme-associated outer membrane protein n=1 Tax=Pelagibaculum spongiae TaxID=2080658 RepID=A0A2V1GT37_9GAMM|nr:MtrB/PioB family outer membrane beta-barrel protein [Pelagibaculum spongiae]PVZ68835.1 hypothetical protein DC094_11305 [Pelagibaculum spongiae]